jgi:Zn-dependent protease
MEPTNLPKDVGNSGPIIGKQERSTGAVIGNSDPPRSAEKKEGPMTGPVIGTVSALGIALYKFKFLILTALKGFSLFKFGWLLKGSASMLLSLGLYTMMFGWRYAVTLIALIYVHEMGHYLWMKVKGLEPNAPVFVPLLGAYTAMNKLPPDPVIHAEVAYAGPFVGGAAAIALYYLSADTNNFYLLAAANTGLILNLLQLLPMKPFDGGFIADCISKKLAIAGVAMAALLGLMLQSILLLILAVVGFFMLVRGKKKITDGEIMASTASPSALDRFRISIGYFGLAGVLGWFYWLSSAQLVQIVQHH